MGYKGSWQRKKEVSKEEYELRYQLAVGKITKKQYEERIKEMNKIENPVKLECHLKDKCGVKSEIYCSTHCSTSWAIYNQAIEQSDKYWEQRLAEKDNRIEDLYRIIDLRKKDRETIHKLTKE